MTTSRGRRAFMQATAATLGAMSLPAFAEPVDIDHTSKIRPVNQGNANLCWLASAAMVKSAKIGSAVTMADLAAQLGKPFSDLHAAGVQNPNGGALSTAQVQLLANKLGMKARGLASFSVEAWIAMIKAGPILCAGYTAGAVMGHAVVIAGLVGDTKPNQELKVRLIDPAGGTAKVQDFRKFIAFYEGLAQAGVPQLLQY